jgi:hypothetical protein
MFSLKEKYRQMYRQRWLAAPILGGISQEEGKMKQSALLMALLVFILIPNVMFAGIYKCVDGNGNTSFSVEPKPGCTLLQESADADRLALLIGNSNYGDGSSLPNPVNDVRAMKRALEGLGFKVIKHENCTQREMKMAMDDFGSKLKGQDVGLFFYAGHGVQVSQYNYLVPVDARLTSEKKVEYNCVRADRVLAEMEGAGSKTNIVILDACRDNPFERSWRRGRGAGLAFMNAPSGSLIAYSTAPGKTALDGGGGNSPYTSALLQHIDIPNTTIIEMFQGVRSTVIAQSEGKQTPWESTSLRGNFYFTKEGTDTRVNDELAILRRERQELKKLRAEIERKQRESQSQRIEVASVPQRPSTSNVIQRDSIYIAYANGIVKDTSTGLEWKAGPDRNTDWNEARSWVQSLNLDGGGWRMPTTDELKALYKDGKGDRNMTPLLKTTGWYVWSGETRGSSDARGFDFSDGYRIWDGRDYSAYNRAFAVRSRGNG